MASNEKFEGLHDYTASMALCSETRYIFLNNGVKILSPYWKVNIVILSLGGNHERHSESDCYFQRHSKCHLTGVTGSRMFTV